MCLVSELRVTWTQLPPGREKGLPHHSPGCPDSSLPGPDPNNPPTSIPVLPGGLHGRGRKICVGYQYVYSWTMHKCVPEASTQAMSLCSLGTHLHASAHAHLFVYGHRFYVSVHAHTRVNARLCSLMCEACARVRRGQLCSNSTHSAAH